MTLTLRVCGWDHPRCLTSLRAAARAWERRRPGVAVEVLVRSGTSFAEEPMEAVAPTADVISFDHPFVGSVAASRCLLPLDELLPAGDLAVLAADAIGPSHASYAWGGQQWGLATDAAAQVSLVREDLLGAGAWPRTWDDALALAREAPGRVTTALGAHDAICALLGLCANAGTPIQPTPERFADPAAALPALEWLRRYAACCHPTAFTGWAFDTLARTDEVVYCLLQWGYTDFARRAYGPRRVRHVDVPSAGLGPVGSTLGGAGLGVSAATGHPAEAAAFAAWLTGVEAQRSVVFANGGQPGSRSVWLDPALDAEAGGFFSGTRATLEAASLRPRDPWWPPLQRDGGEVIARGLASQADPEDVLAGLEAVYQAVLAAPIAAPSC